ncbi:hypothetical protein [Hymenobacter chitinivorans]|uniref:HTH cro/C1-type domain-containing protein n=1 Tax=Hymenobacter chitinivorans DSM 11115 TaxID=1121954 RepID=A0A2M9BN99_9BACT|nr:hypothetical protein [Hymenobacter chitinivorans]PJJ59412.1 hypothetical protein CLV45_0829 [Hymenobacter chitinivorans DSM 11115]
MEEPEYSINQRIAVLVDLKAKGNKSSFARHIGVAPSVVSDILGGRKNKPGFDILNKIASAYSDVNTSWLLLGEGEIFTSGGDTPLTQTNVSGKKNAVNIAGGKATQTNTTLSDCEKERDLYRAERDLAQKEVALLRDQLAMKDDLIAAKDEMLQLLRGGYNRPN